MKITASKTERNINSIVSLIQVLTTFEEKFGDKNLTAEVMNFGVGGKKAQYEIYFTWEEEIS